MEKNEDIVDKDFLEEELSEINDIIFGVPETDQNTPLESSTGQIRFISFTKLIEKLTSTNPTLLKDVLLTYRGFQSPKVLLLALIKRFLTASEQDRPTVQLSYWSDFKQDLSTLLPILEQFLDNISKSEQLAERSLRRAIDRLSDQLKSQLTLKPKLQIENSYLQCATLEESDPIELLDYISPIELAEQLTMNEWHVWSKIQPSELVNLNWTKNTKQETSPNVLHFMQKFNLMSKWVAMSIVTVEDLERRVLRMEHWLLTAKYLVELHNFNGALAIIGGLQHLVVYRLTKTTWAIRTGWREQIFSNLQELFKYAKNYKVLRECLKNANLPCIPYLGMYLTDLTFIAYSGRDNSGNQLIEWERHERVAEVLAQIRKYQSVAYKLTSGTFIQQKIDSFEFFTDDELIACSDYLEPRGPNRPKPDCLVKYHKKQQ